MQSILSLSDHLPSKDNSPATPTTDQRIRMTECTGGYLPVPHSLNALLRRKLKGSRNTVFWFVWDKTIRHDKKTDRIPIVQFINALADSESTISRTIKWLSENDWLVVIETPGQITEFGIPEWILEFCFLPEEEPEMGSGQNDPATRFILTRIIRSSDHKKDLPPTPHKVSTGKSAEKKIEEGGEIASLSDDQIEAIAKEHENKYETKLVVAGLNKMRKCKVKADVNVIMGYDFDDVYEVVDEIYKRWNSADGRDLHSPGGMMVKAIQGECEKL